MILTLSLSVTVFVACIPINIRDGIPSNNRLFGVSIGIFGLAGFASEGWDLMSAALTLIGSIGDQKVPSTLP
jgi:hypothetical protein